MKNRCLLKLFISLTMLTSFSSWSQCSRDDVEFYLKSGFTQEQIVNLCSKPLSESKQESKLKSDAPDSEILERSAVSPSSSEFDPIQVLMNGIDGKSITLTDSHISFIGELCIRAGNSPEVNQRVRKCIESDFFIAKKDLEVHKIKTGLFSLGQKSIEISSEQIDIKPLEKSPWSTFSPEMSRLVERQYQSTTKKDRISIPINRDSDEQKVAKALRMVALSR